MTDLFVGGEDTSFTLVGSYSFSASGSGTSFRAAFARGVVGYSASGTPSTADPPANRATTPTFAATSSFWIHGLWANQNSNTASLNTTLLRVLDAGVARIVVRGTATAGQLKIETRNAAGTFTTLVTSAAGALPVKTTPTAIDLWINYAVSGQAQLWVDGANVADTGAGVDVTTNSATTMM